MAPKTISALKSGWFLDHLLKHRFYDSFEYFRIPHTLFIKKGCGIRNCRKIDVLKGGPKNTRTSNRTSFWEPFWLICSSFFITFLETSKTGFGTTLQYFRRFLLPKGSHFGVQFRFRFRSVFGPLKKAPPGQDRTQPLATPGQLFGPAGGGFRRGVC